MIVSQSVFYSDSSFAEIAQYPGEEYDDIDYSSTHYQKSKSRNLQENTKFCHKRRRKQDQSKLIKINVEK